MSHDEQDDSNSSNSENETKEKSQDLVKFSKKNIFLYDKKCRTVLHLGVLYKNLTKAAANAINLDKITSKIQSMIDKNQIYLRDAGPIILGITKIVDKKTYILFEDIEELTKLRINSKEQIRTVNKEKQDNSKDEEDSNKKDIINLNGKPLLGNEIKGSNGTNALNINSLDNDSLNFKNTHLFGFETAKKNKKNNNYLDFSFNKDDIVFGDDDMIRRTIQKMSRLNDKDIRDIISTNKKNKDKKEIQFDTENKNSKTLQNLRDMLFNKNKNKENEKLDNTNIDENNKDVEGFFTVIKTQIEEPINTKNNNSNIEDAIDGSGNDGINFDFDINVNNLKDEYFSNKKYNINKNDEMKNNLKLNKNKKKPVFLLKGKLKFDEDIEIEMDEPGKKLTKKEQKELDTKLEKENESKLETMQSDFDLFQFNKDLLTSFNNEKFEYLLPSFLAGDETKNEDNTGSIVKYLRKEESIGESSSKINMANNSESNLQSNEKSDIARLNRLTTSNKKRFSISNFDSENKSLLHNLSRLTLDKNDFKGSTSYVEKLRNLNKGTETKEDNNREDDNDNYNSNYNDMDLNEQEENNQNDDYGEKNKNKAKYITEDIKEEEDVIQLKDDLKKNVLKNKKNISFPKIRNKLDNSDKFIEPKLFYDLLLMAQKGDINISQKKLMDNESINISL